MRHQEIIEQIRKMGEPLLEVFKPKHECYKLIELIITTEPEDIPFPGMSEIELAHDLCLMDDKLDSLFDKVRNELKLLFLNDELKHVLQFPEDDIPIKKAVFVIKLDHEQTITIPSRMTEQFQLGINPSRYFNSELLGDMKFTIKSRWYDVDIDGVVVVHYCVRD